jgi:hypothetical protein
MGAVAKKIDPHHVTQEIAIVDEVRAGKARVRAAGASYEAARAVSCLVAPEPGDRVLVAINEAGSAWVLAVLERDDASVTTIAVEGELSLQSSGPMRLSSDESVSVATEGPVAIVSRELKVSTTLATLVADATRLVGKRAEAHVAKVKLVAEAFEGVVARFSQRLGSSQRTITEAEHVRAGSLDYRADGAVALQGETAVVTAKDVVKVDGAQIQLG